jgi:hypothetical protein
MGGGAEPRLGIRYEVRRSSSRRRHILPWVRYCIQVRIRPPHWPR